MYRLLAEIAFVRTTGHSPRVSMFRVPPRLNSNLLARRRRKSRAKFWLSLLSTLLLVFSGLGCLTSGASSVEEERAEVHVQTRSLVRSDQELPKSSSATAHRAWDGSGDSGLQLSSLGCDRNSLSGHRLPNGLRAPLTC